MFRTPALKMIVGLGAFSLAGILMYIHYKNKDDDDEDEIDSTNKRTKSLLNNKDISMKLVLPNDKIPLIIGRGGCNLRIIEEKTNTSIRFFDKDDNNKLCEIIGKSDNVYKAKEMISIDLNRSSTIKEEIFVPQNVCGKIIGRCGESLQEICRKSLAKVSVDSGNGSSGSSNHNITRRVIITGNRNQVNIAKKLIEEKIKEDENNRKELEETELKREPRRSPTNSISSLHSSLTSLGSLSYLPSKEKLIFNENQSIEVYVSAIASPAKFWLQLIGPQSKKLDELVSNMTEYYNCAENQNSHKIDDPYLGQIVAALFKYDGKWYRAEIVGILPNEYNPRDVVLDLYFVDYGDSEYVEPHEVFELRTDFLTLRFQAIECYLAHVKPIISNDPDNWDSSSISKFEELTHVASWKKLKSHTVTYKERPKGGNHIRREGSPVPGVELFDTIEGTEINIAHMLVTHGFATLEYPEGNDVLRLGGGDYTNLTSSYPTTTNYTSDENIPANQQQQENNDTTNQVEQILNGQAHDNGAETSHNKFGNGFGTSLTHSKLNGGGNNNNKIEQNNPIKLINSKTETDNFLQTEKTHGTNITKPTATNDKKWNQLIS